MKKTNCGICDKELDFTKCQFLYGGYALCLNHSEIARIVMIQRYISPIINPIKIKPKNLADSMGQMINEIKLYESEYR